MGVWVGLPWQRAHVIISIREGAQVKAGGGGGAFVT